MRKGFVGDMEVQLQVSRENGVCGRYGGQIASENRPRGLWVIWRFNLHGNGLVR